MFKGLMMLLDRNKYNFTATCDIQNEKFLYTVLAI